MNTAKKITRQPQNGRHSPGGYGPKTIPAILDMAQKIQAEIRPVQAIRAFDDVLEIFSMPDARVIGKEITVPLHKENPVPAYVQGLSQTEDWHTIRNLPKLVPQASFGWTCDYVAETDSFSYLVAGLTPAGTLVPDGFSHRDIAATLVARGGYGQSIESIVKKLEDIGYTTNWNAPGCGWNAEMYLLPEEENPPIKGCKEDWHWLVPCKRKEGK